MNSIRKLKKKSSIFGKSMRKVWLTFLYNKEPFVAMGEGKCSAGYTME